MLSALFMMCSDVTERTTELKLLHATDGNLQNGRTTRMSIY